MMNRYLAASLVVGLLALPVLGDTPSSSAASSGSAVADLYDANCADCHGDSGQGNGPKARMLQPAPADLTRTTYKHGVSDDDVFNTVFKGVPGTSMPSFGSQLKGDQIQALVSYLKTLRKAPTAK